MQDFLHMRTLLFVESIIGLILFLCMFYIYRARKTYPGFSFWTVSSLLFFLGNILLGLRGVLPDFMTIILANCTILSSLAFILYGLTLFANKKHPIWLYTIVLLILALTLIFFTYFISNVGMRIVTLSVTFTLFCISALTIIYRSIPPFLKSSNLLLELSLIGGGTWSLFRAVYTILYEKGMKDFLSASSIQGTSVLVYSALFVSLFFGLSILNFQRVEIDLLKTKEEIKELSKIIPICASCKKIRDDSGFWNQVESYIQSHSDAKLSHAICPECMDKLYPDYTD